MNAVVVIVWTLAAAIVVLAGISFAEEAARHQAWMARFES